ncbi:MAG: dihydroorotase [Cyanobacteria bacterium P01_G01_bin.39]
MSTGICQEIITRMELLQQVRIIDPVQQRDQVADVLIVEGRIEAIAEEITDYPAQATVYQPSGFILGTGLADIYSHSGEPGHETRETLGQLSQAAAAGGFTQVGILPDTVPMIDNVETLAAIKQKSNYLSSDSQLNLPQLHFWGHAYDSQWQQMTELGELASEIVGFTSQHNLANLQVLKQILEYLEPWQKPLALVLHHNELSAGGVVRTADAAIRYGMPENPSFSEAAIIAAVLEMVAEIPAPIHFMRVSTARGVELIADAKARGLTITASTTWMHLLWNSDSIGSYNPDLRLEPPLGDQLAQTALIDGVKQGIIDAIAIDHQAYTYEEKTVAFALAPPGVVGLELALPMLWQNLVVSGRCSPLQLWQALSSRPRQCMQQTSKAITLGQAADLVLFDPEQKWIANRDSLKSPAANTPWYNQEITGKVIKTWANSV